MARLQWNGCFCRFARATQGVRAWKGPKLLLAAGSRAGVVHANSWQQGQEENQHQGGPPRSKVCVISFMMGVNLGRLATMARTSMCMTLLARARNEHTYMG